MGRTEKSQGLAPPAIRKDIRAKYARQIINKTIPAFLASQTRARKGSESSELIVDPVANAHAPRRPEPENGEDEAYIKRKGQGRRKVKTERGAETVNHGKVDVGSSKSRGKGRRRQDSVDYELGNLDITDTDTASTRTERKIRIITADTLTAAHILAYPAKYDIVEPKPPKKSPNVCILNMASPLRPGGGVLTGATSQEEFLCARTTLLPSLKEPFYRLPELGGIWSPDVLVFRNSLSLGDTQGELAPADRYWLDVISAGMLRFPELEGKEGEVKMLSKSDRAMVEHKMRAVMRIAASKGVKKIVLGAWGCGAYGNPVSDIARAWKKVLDGTSSATSKKRTSSANAAETWPTIETIVFAIMNRKMAIEFARAFDTKIEVEHAPSDAAEHEDDDDDEDVIAQELRAKIAEMESQLSQVWNPDLKSRMGIILAGLNAQLLEREGQAHTPDTGSISGEGVKLSEVEFMPTPPHGYEDVERILAGEGSSGEGSESGLE
ncbi:hypothetical protein CC86DRAFT_370673 [Ophiobolus disseminans]|uniref:Microbial-type PARG catalytic domain-containing protein n=1 Tax=Ophiobolus disseminans TaxID=1469910 RepID=A0A6A6ZXJ8_9PLEO|nr:hypothetical protein CC86DRAFT_370673 [Ophiobolus disseminans]